MSIEITGLQKSFGDVPVIANLDLRVPSGKMVVLLGPSGCGKTTTMRCIAGLDTPNRGRITVGDRIVFDADAGTNVPVEQRQVGMVFQSYAIWPHLTVFKNVAFPLEIQRRPRNEIVERVNDALALVGLADFASRGASQLSGGQMQRVALARSLVNKPAVLLLDEPLSNLDARLRDYLRLQLRELQTQLAITALYVTHDQNEALALADQIVVLRSGTILQSGSPIELYTRPRTSAVAAFLGYSNIFAASLTQRDGARASAVFEDGGETIAGIVSDGEWTDGISACVRPGDVRIARKGSAGALPANAYLGDVIVASFEGSHLHYQVRTAGGRLWDLLSTDVAGAIAIGTTVTVSVAPENVLLLPRDGAA